jgi:hypothetical protein
MRRFPHGVTTRPTPARPANGYGRTLRPGPDQVLAIRLFADVRLLDASTGDPRRR